MKSYGYVARDLTGIQKKGFLQAACSNEVLNQLRKQGFTPISVKEIPLTAKKSQQRARRKRIKSADLATLCWQLSTMLQGGIPITTALEIISEDTDNLTLRDILHQLSDKVKKGQPFSVFKFRSMRVGAETEQQSLAELNEADGPLFKIKDDPRSTRVGRFIRKASLDELPQLINVLCGEMSMVGPRPPLASEVTEYESWQRKRLEVKPGMTGLWQVSGRSDLTFDEMCLLDIYYIENWSLWLDMRMILRTIPLFFLGKGAY